MKKKIIVSLTVITAAVVLTSAPPLQSMAAEKTNVNITNPIPVNMQDLKEKFANIENSGYSFSGSNCNIIIKPCLPGTGTPNPDNPETGNPGIPDSGTPDNPGTESPDKPETDTPDNPGAGTPDKPETDTPDNPGTGTPDSPGTGTPDTDQPGEESPEQTFSEQVVVLVNQERAKMNLPPLEIRKDVENAALVRAREIKTSFSHTRPDGTSFSTALKEQAVDYRSAGENIAWGQQSPQQVMDAWMNSEGHRNNILSGNFTNIGVGYYQDEAGVSYWTQLFTN